MGIVVTVMNMKGGVGKTTVSAHIAGALSRNVFHGIDRVRHRRVLAIDYDPQFNLSQAYLPAKKYFEAEKARKTTLAILVDDDVTLNPYHLQVPGNLVPPSVKSLTTNIATFTDNGRLDLIPSTLDLMYVALGQADTQIKPMEERFSKFIDEARTAYDIILIDCHPAGSIFTKTSLTNSDHVLIPVMPQRFATRGIGLMMNFIAAKKKGTAGPIPHILFNGVPRRGVSKEELEIRANSRYVNHCMTNTLKWYSAFSEPEEGTGFVWNSNKPYSTEAFYNLFAVATEFLQRIGANAP